MSHCPLKAMLDLTLTYDTSILETESSGSLCSPAHPGLSQKDRDSQMDSQPDGQTGTLTLPLTAGDSTVPISVASKSSPGFVFF